MPFSVQRVGEFLGARADRLAIAPFPSSSPEVITLVWNGNDVKHTLWTLLDNGDLFATELHNQPGGPELAIAPFSETRLVSMHRAGPAGALKFEAWETGGIFELSDDASAPADRDPQIVTFGGDPGILPVPQTATVEARDRIAFAAAPGGAGPVQPGTTSPPAHKPILKKKPPKQKVVVTLQPKAGHAVLASLTQNHHLRVSLWGFDNGGDIKVLAGKHAEADGGTAGSVSIVKVKEQWAEGPLLKGAEVVTASSGEGQALKLQRWRVTLGSQNAPASVQLLGEHTAAELVTEVSAAPVLALGGTQVATAVRLQDGTLKLIGWKMEPGGGITRWTEAGGGAIQAVSASLVRGHNIVTALREADGRFKASYWRFPSDPSGAIEHRGDAVEGPIGFHVRCAHVAGEGNQLGDTVAAVRSEDGKLQLFRYRVTE
jgi:hypothetical protein